MEATKLLVRKKEGTSVKEGHELLTRRVDIQVITPCAPRAVAQVMTPAGTSRGQAMGGNKRLREILSREESGESERASGTL